MYITLTLKRTWGGGFQISHMLLRFSPPQSSNYDLILICRTLLLENTSLSSIFESRNQERYYCTWLIRG